LLVSSLFALFPPVLLVCAINHNILKHPPTHTDKREGKEQCVQGEARFRSSGGTTNAGYRNKNNNNVSTSHPSETARTKRDRAKSQAWESPAPQQYANHRNVAFQSHCWCLIMSREMV
jgi:hypothetical protein